MTYLKLLTIAGSDSGGGAGIQADLKTWSALGGYGMTAITALTAQNTLGVQAIFPISPDFVAAQIDAIFADIGVDAVKIGMLYSAEIVQVVAKKLHQYLPKYIVIDPVMVATSGDILLQNEAIEAMKSALFPLATIITPNMPEAGVLLGKKIETIADMEMAVPLLTQWGSKSALLKGGHLTEGQECWDMLYIPNNFQVEEICQNWVITSNTHGTGCTLSAAITFFLAKGYEIDAAVKAARIFLQNALVAAKDMQLGKGKGPVKWG